MTRSVSARTGPTHQPVEHLSALRAIPHLAVYRPGDPVETAECWENILDNPRRAALLALSRQPMPLLRREPGEREQVRPGRLRAAGGRGRPAQADADGHGLGAASGRRGTGRCCRAKACRPPWCPMPCAPDLRRTGRGLPAGRAGRDPGAGGGRGGGADELGSLSRPVTAALSACTGSANPGRSPMFTRSSTSRPRPSFAPRGTVSEPSPASCPAPGHQRGVSGPVSLHRRPPWPMHSSSSPNPACPSG